MAVWVFLFFVSLLLIGTSKHRSVLIYLLLACLLLGPRVPFGQFANLQRLDVRLDDLVIMIICLSSLIMVLSKQTAVRYSPFMTFLSIFIISTFMSSLTGSVIGGFRFTPSFIYWGKEVEYMSLAFTIPLFIVNVSEIANVVKTIGVSLILNLCWLFFQIISGAKAG